MFFTHMTIMKSDISEPTTQIEKNSTEDIWKMLIARMVKKPKIPMEKVNCILLNDLTDFI